jgi:hypothetical protein
VNGAPDGGWEHSIHPAGISPARLAIFSTDLGYSRPSLRLVLFCAIAQDGSQRVECRRLNKLQGIRVVMIERFAATFDQECRFDVVRPASVIIESYVAAIAGRAERFVQEFR